VTQKECNDTAKKVEMLWGAGGPWARLNGKGCSEGKIGTTILEDLGEKRRASDAPAEIRHKGWGGRGGRGKSNRHAPRGGVSTKGRGGSQKETRRMVRAA